MDLCVIPECYVDTNLIETLVPPNTRYNHQKGCGTVSNKMIKYFSNSFALGIIDKDKREIEYLKKFDLSVEFEDIFLFQHKSLPHFIIQIYPDMERFFLKNAKIAGLKISDFNLPTDLKELKKVSKSVSSKKDDRFKRLFKSIKNIGTPQFTKLTNWIIYLKEQNYNYNLEEIRLL